MKCRFCGKILTHKFIDLGMAPPSNAYLNKEDLRKPMPYFPLRLFVCRHCWLVQTEDYACADELFCRDYAYFSSTSASWLYHAEEYCRMIQEKVNFGPESHVIEIASNDGYLLKNFVKWGVPCLGIEPTDSTADAAEKLGVPVLREFFTFSLAERLAEEKKQADLLIGNNVYAHVPDINDFTAGMKMVLKPGGTITMEFPHLMRLIEKAQFDTIYHEHYSYLSLFIVRMIFSTAGLRVFDVEELPTHGGSLRIYGCHQEDSRQETKAVADLVETEKQCGLQDFTTYSIFQERIDRIKNDFLTFLLEQKKQGNRIAAYGAAAKGNTLLNYAGIKPDLIPYVCDAALSKQGKFLPGSRIPIVPPETLKKERPDLIIILPWNIAGEIMQQHAYIYEWGGQFITTAWEGKRPEVKG